MRVTTAAVAGNAGPLARKLPESSLQPSFEISLEKSREAADDGLRAARTAAAPNPPRVLQDRTKQKGFQTKASPDPRTVAAPSQPDPVLREVDTGKSTGPYTCSYGVSPAQPELTGSAREPAMLMSLAAADDESGVKTVPPGLAGSNNLAESASTQGAVVAPLQALGIGNSVVPFLSSLLPEQAREDVEKATDPKSELTATDPSNQAQKLTPTAWPGTSLASPKVMSGQPLTSINEERLSLAEQLGTAKLTSNKASSIPHSSSLVISEESANAHGSSQPNATAQELDLESGLRWSKRLEEPSVPARPALDGVETLPSSIALLPANALENLTVEVPDTRFVPEPSTSEADQGLLEGLSGSSILRTRGQANPSEPELLLSGTLPGRTEHRISAELFAAVPPPARDGEVITANRAQPPSAPSSSGATSSGLIPPDLAAAQLIQSLGRSGMQVHLNAAEFGRVSVHATYGRDGIAAQISLQETELGSALHAALASHVPSVEQKLSATGTRASVTVDTMPNADSGAKNQQDSEAPPHRRNTANVQSESLAPGGRITSAPVSAPIPRKPAENRLLDIHI